MTFTQIQLDNCSNLEWLGFEAGVEYSPATILWWVCQYLEPNVQMKNNGDHPPKPPKHL